MSLNRLWTVVNVLCFYGMDEVEGLYLHKKDKEKYICRVFSLLVK